MRARILIFFLIIILISLVFAPFSCNKKKVYQNFFIIDDNNWAITDTLNFDFQTKNNINNNYNITLFGKTNQSYPYANLFLFTEIISKKNILIRDTLHCVLYNHFGKPLERNIGNLIFFKINYLDSVVLNSNTKYTCRIIHGMRDKDLMGVETIGIKINYN